MASKWNTGVTVWVEMISDKKCWFSHAIGGFFRERRDPAGIVARQEAAQTTRFSDASSSRMQIGKIKVSVEHNLNRLRSFPLRFSAFFSKLFLPPSHPSTMITIL